MTCISCLPAASDQYGNPGGRDTLKQLAHGLVQIYHIQHVLPAHPKVRRLTGLRRVPGARNGFASVRSISQRTSNQVEKDAFHVHSERTPGRAKPECS
jgi:hypothetical protein